MILPNAAQAGLHVADVSILPLDSLLCIFAELSELQKRAVLPLVCREWSAACREASTLWKSVRVHDEEQHRALGGGVRFALLRAWLLHRAASIISLELRFGSRRHDLQAGSLATLLPSMATSGALQSLSLGLASTKLQPRDFSALGHVTSLRHLQLEAACRAGLLRPALQALGPLSRLRSLDVCMHLGGCAGVRDFPSNILQLTQLRRLRLHIANIDFSSLPQEVTQLRYLEELELSECLLLPDVIVKREPLPEGFGALPLTRLRLAPYAFAAHIDRHGFANDPLVELRGLTGLRELDLERAQVEPKAFESGSKPVEALSALQQLTALRLQKSPVFANNLPRWMQLDSLVCLDLSFCELMRVPSCLYAAGALQNVDLGCNRLLRTPAATQVDWSSVEKVELQHNYLERLPQFVAPHLRVLSIRNNGPLFQFEDIDVLMFTEDRWPALEVLDVDRGKNDDVGAPGPDSLPPPRWTYKSLHICFMALAAVAKSRDVRVILHRGPVREHQVVLRTADVLGKQGELLSAEGAYDRRFG